jgi:hypothetical protein
MMKKLSFKRIQGKEKKQNRKYEIKEICPNGSRITININKRIR